MAQLHPNARPGKTQINAMIRVNQAGEYGALRIYAGQLDGLRHDDVKPIIHHMVEQEQHHLDVFNKMMAQHNIPKTIFTPLWHVGGYMLGYLSARLGVQHAMACTVAVEQVIDHHYQDQIDYLADLEPQAELRKNLIQFRAEELEHRDIGQSYTTVPFRGQRLFSLGVTGITKLAIWLSKRI